MHNNDFRAIGLGALVGAAVFGGLLLWVDHDPLGMIAEHLAKAKLSPAERAELDRLAAERHEKHRKFLEVCDRDAEAAAGFAPYLLTTVPVVDAAADLTLANLVAEIEHCEQAMRNGTISGHDRHRH